MYCVECGKEVPEGQLLCDQCQAKKEQEKQQAKQAEYQRQQGGYQQNQQQTWQVPPNAKSKIAAGLLGIFLGSLGIHKFYLGYTTPGLIMVLVSVIGGFLSFGIISGIMGLIGFIEGIIYLTKSDVEFYQTYEEYERGWF